MKAEKWLFECRNLEEKYESVTKEKEVRLRSQRTLNVTSNSTHNSSLLVRFRLDVRTILNLKGGVWKQS